MMYNNFRAKRKLISMHTNPKSVSHWLLLAAYSCTLASVALSAVPVNGSSTLLKMKPL